jgi:hypothetical protein
MSKVVLFNHKTFNLEQWSIEEIIRCINSPTEKIQVMPPEFQRDFIASLKWQRDLIDSFYNGLSSNLIHFRKLDKEKASKIGFAYQCLDGLQRLSTTINFVNNKFDDNNGKFFRELSKKEQENVLSYTFTLYVYAETMTDEEAGETFCRINNANDLNDQEMLNAIPGYVSQTVRSQARSGQTTSVLPVFETYIDVKGTRRPKNGLGMLPGVRLAYDALLARWYTVEYDKQKNPNNLAFHGSGINKPHTTKMYRDANLKSQYVDGKPVYLADYTWAQPKEFASIEKEVIRRAKFVHDCLSADIENNKKFFKTDGKIHALYDLSYELENVYGKNCVKDFKKFVRGVKEVLATHLDEKKNKDGALYFQRLLGCGTGHEILEKIAYFMDAIYADPDYFGIVEMDYGKISDADKMQILIKQKHTCWIDEQEASIDDVEAAHIIARSLGGKNVVSNYVLVRKQYNRNMGTMTPQDYKQKYFPQLCGK